MSQKERMRRLLQARLCGGTKQDRRSAESAQIVQRHIEWGQHGAGDGLHFIDHDDAVAQSRYPADAGGLAGKQRVQQLYQCGDHNGSRPRLHQQFILIQLITGLFLYHVGMMLEDKLVIVQILAYDFRVLIQNGKQRNHEDYALLFMFGGCRQSIAKGGQRFPSPGGDIQPVNARAPLGRRFAAVGNRPGGPD